MASVFDREGIGDAYGGAARLLVRSIAWSGMSRMTHWHQRLLETTAVEAEATRAAQKRGSGRGGAVAAIENGSGRGGTAAANDGDKRGSGRGGAAAAIESGSGRGGTAAANLTLDTARAFRAAGTAGTSRGTAAAAEERVERDTAGATRVTTAGTTGGTAAAPGRQASSNNFTPAAINDKHAIDGDKRGSGRGGAAAAIESGSGRGGTAAAEGSGQGRAARRRRMAMRREGNVFNVLGVAAAGQVRGEGGTSASHGAKTLPELRERPTGGEGL